METLTCDNEIITRYTLEGNKLVIHHNFTENFDMVTTDIILNDEPVIVHHKKNVYLAHNDNYLLYLHNGVLHSACFSMNGEGGSGERSETFFDVLYPMLIENGEQVRMSNIDKNDFYFGATNTFMKYNGYLYVAGSSLGAGTQEDSYSFQKLKLINGDDVHSNAISDIVITSENITMTYAGHRYIWGDGKHKNPTRINSTENVQPYIQNAVNNPIVMESHTQKSKLLFIFAIILLIVLILFVLI